MIKLPCPSCKQTAISRYVPYVLNLKSLESVEITDAKPYPERPSAPITYKKDMLKCLNCGLTVC